jgi:hypothetical protein
MLRHRDLRNKLGGRLFVWHQCVTFNRLILREQLVIGLGFSLLDAW